jgi:hypothetical protein
VKKFQCGQGLKLCESGVLNLALLMVDCASILKLHSWLVTAPAWGKIVKHRPFDSLTLVNYESLYIGLLSQ